VSPPLDTSSSTSAAADPSATGTRKPGALPRPVALFRDHVLRAEHSSVLAATVILIALIAVRHPEFLKPTQIISVLEGSVYVGLFAIGLTFLLAMREVDLSVASGFALTLVSAALLITHGWNPWLAAVAAIAIGGGLGLLNALIVQFIRIPSLMATVATASLYRGAAVGLSKGEQVTGMPLKNPLFTVFGGKILGLPTGVWVLFILAVVMTFVLRTTPFGFRVRAIGSNPEAAEFSGIPVRRVRFQAMILLGAFVGLAGVIGLAYFTSGDPTIGSGYELNAVAAVIIGGTPLRGGTASVIGSVLGVILLSTVTSGLVYFNIPVNWSQFVTGAVILLALGLDSAVRARRRRTRKPKTVAIV
jgi:ribose transport system permease protein